MRTEFMDAYCCTLCSQCLTALPCIVSASDADALVFELVHTHRHDACAAAEVCVQSWCALEGLVGLRERV